MRIFKKESENFGITSFIFGILSAITIFSPSMIVLLTPLFSIIAIVFSVVQKLKRGKSKFGLIGLIFAIISLVMFLIWIMMVLLFFNTPANASYSTG